MIPSRDPKTNPELFSEKSSGWFFGTASAGSAEKGGRVKPKGVTLIELVVTITVVAVLAGGTALCLVQGTNLWSRVTSQTDALGQAHVALDRMQRELAQVRDDASVATANATTFAFTSVGNEAIQYQYAASDGTLRRNGQLLAGGVSSCAFQYWNVQGQSLSAPLVIPPATKTDLWRVGVTLTLASGMETVTLSAQVVPRNFFRANK